MHCAVSCIRGGPILGWLFLLQHFLEAMSAGKLLLLRKPSMETPISRQRRVPLSGIFYQHPHLVLSQKTLFNYTFYFYVWIEIFWKEWYQNKFILLRRYSCLFKVAIQKNKSHLSTAHHKWHQAVIMLLWARTHNFIFEQPKKIWQKWPFITSFDDVCLDSWRLFTVFTEDRGASYLVPVPTIAARLRQDLLI